MYIILDILAVLLGLTGLAGCILPVLPGPPMSYLALVLLYFWGKDPISTRFMIIWLIITIIVTVLDYIVPAWFTRITKGTRAAAGFSLAGMLAGILFFPPFGMIIGAFIGALAGEWIYGKKKDLGQSLKAAAGSFLGFLCGTGLKLIASGIMLYYIVVFL